MKMPSEPTVSAEIAPCLVMAPDDSPWVTWSRLTTAISRTSASFTARFYARRPARIGEDRSANERSRRPLSADRRLRHARRPALGSPAQQAGVDRLDVSAAIRQPLDLRPAVGLGQRWLSPAAPAGWCAGVSAVPTPLQRAPTPLDYPPSPHPP